MARRLARVAGGLVVAYCLVGLVGYGSIDPCDLSAQEGARRLADKTGYTLSAEALRDRAARISEPNRLRCLGAWGQLVTARIIGI